MKVPISKIGDLQRRDIESSSGTVLYDRFGRICTVVKPDGGIGDRSPYRMAEMFGGGWQDYNNQYVIQVAGCPLNCRYCYVDNLEEDTRWSAISIVENFLAFRWDLRVKFHKPLNVLHFMGGAPGIYCDFWKELREELNYRNCEHVILFTDVIFVEGFTRQVRPWHCMDLERFIVAGCLKGTNRENFEQNTGKDLFSQAVMEMFLYTVHDNFYLTLLGYDEADLPKVRSWVEPWRIDLLNIVEYEATKAKMRTYANIGW